MINKIPKTSNRSDALEADNKKLNRVIKDLTERDNALKHIRQKTRYDVKTTGSFMLNSYVVNVVCKVDGDLPEGLYFVQNRPERLSIREIAIRCQVISIPCDGFMLMLENTHPNKQAMIFKEGDVIAEMVRIS